MLKQLIGKKISGINRVCDLVCLQFGSENEKDISLHIQSFFRFVKNGKVLICSDDMCRCDPACDQELFEWDVPGNSVYDASIKANRDILFNSKVLSANTNLVGDLIIVFEHDIELQILIDTVESEEKYRIFNDCDEFVKES